MRNFLMTTAAALLVSGAVYAQTTGAGDKTEYDANLDNVIGQDEFQGSPWRGGERFSDWDTDQDDMLSRDEISQGVFQRYDEDGDGNWDDEEFQKFQADQESGESWF